MVYPPGSHSLAVFHCLFSCLVFCTEDYSVLACNSNPSPALLGFCFIPSDAAKVSLALPRRGSKIKASLRLLF